MLMETAETHKPAHVMSGYLQHLLEVAENTSQHAKKASAFDLNACVNCS